MCSPLLTGGLTGYGISQANKSNRPNQEATRTTNNYYGVGDADAQMNKDSLKAGNQNRPVGNSQSSRTNIAV